MLLILHTPGEEEQKVYHDPTGKVADSRRERTTLEREVIARHDAAEVSKNVASTKGKSIDKPITKDPK